MDIRVLQYFLTVAREQSITKAAEALNMTQPPLSRQMKDLEDEIGKPLLIRGSKRVTLTEDGLLLKKRAEELVDLMEKTKLELSGSDEDITGEIRIACGETAAVGIVAKAAQSLYEEHPHLHYRLYSGDAELVLDQLDKGLVDFGLLIGQVDIGKYEYLRFPVRDRWGVVMHRSSPLAEKQRICVEDLLDQPLILSHQSTENSEMAAWLHLDKYTFNIVESYNLAYNASLFVKKGFGNLVALDRIITDSELCFRPLEPPMEAEIFLVWKKHQVFSRATRMFLSRLREVIRDYLHTF